MKRAKNLLFYRPFRGQFKATIVGLTVFFDVQCHHEKRPLPLQGISVGTRRKRA